MSDLMFFGVLRMPYEMAMEGEISRLQFYNRVQEACYRIERLESELAALRAAAGALIKAKGRYHTEQNYLGLVAAFDGPSKEKSTGSSGAYRSGNEATRRQIDAAIAMADAMMLQAKPGGDRRKVTAPIGFSERRQQDRRAMQSANMLRMQSEDD